MKTFSLYGAVFLVLASVTGVAAAEQENASEERTEHYEVMALPNTQEALAWLAEKPEKMNTAMDDRQFEMIHEESYYLEAAVDSLRSQAKDEAQLQAVDALDESVQTVHYASEEHQEEQLKTALPLLLVHAKQVRSLF